MRMQQDCGVHIHPVSLARSISGSLVVEPQCAHHIRAGPADDVVDLDAATFESRVLKGNEFWVIEWYANWCGGCKMVAPWYKEAASALKKEGISFGAMNMDLHGERGRSYGVKGMRVHAYASMCTCIKLQRTLQLQNCRT